MGTKTKEKLSPLQQFQKKIGAVPDGFFGKETLQKGRDFLELTDNQAVHFFAQCAHESNDFKVFMENLNYSKEGLLAYFKKYFETEAQAAKYAKKPSMIASRVYADRMGNGDEESKDGWKYRGRGAIQLTGKDNYEAFSKEMGKDFVKKPDEVATKYAFDSALFFFNKNNLWELCNSLDPYFVKRLTLKINGGNNGLQHRLQLTRKYEILIKKK